MEMNESLAQLSDDLLAVHRRKWWQFWKPKITEHDIRTALAEALIGEHEPIERYGRIE